MFNTTCSRCVLRIFAGDLVITFKDTVKAHFCYYHVLLQTTTTTQAILSILKLLICSFNGCSFNSVKKINRLRQEIYRNIFNSVKETNRVRKEINRLLSKRMSNIYLKVTIDTVSKLQFSEFKNIVTGSILWSSNLRRYQ